MTDIPPDVPQADTPRIPPDIPAMSLAEPPDVLHADAAPEPRQISEVDRQLTRNLKQAGRTRWILVIAVIVLLAASVSTMAVIIGTQESQIHLQQSELQSSCTVWRILSPEPVTIIPPATRPTSLSVSLIAGARDAYAGQHCGHLPPADPSLVKWADFYHIPLP